MLAAGTKSGYVFAGGAGTTFTGYSGQALFLPNWFVRRRGLAMSIAAQVGDLVAERV